MWFMNKKLGFYFFSKKNQPAIYARHFVFVMTTGLESKDLDSKGIKSTQNEASMKTQRLSDDGVTTTYFHQCISLGSKQNKAKLAKKKNRRKYQMSYLQTPL